MQQQIATIWLQGTLDAPIDRIMSDGETSCLLAVLIDGIDGPTIVNVEARGESHADNITRMQPAKGDLIMVHGTIIDDPDSTTDVQADLIGLAVSSDGTGA